MSAYVSCGISINISSTEALPVKYQVLSKHSTLQVVVLLAGYVAGLAYQLTDRY